MKQRQAIDILKSGRNVFLTGSAGTGKTYVLNQYIRYLKGSRVNVAVTASTGIAATHMNGMTIHSWSGIGIREKLTGADLSALEARKYLKDQLEDAQVLIIDEISMLHGYQLDMVNSVLKHFRKNDRPFGGVQVVFSGDFFQLPPVGDGDIGSRFSFMAPSWMEAGLTLCYLTEQHRQDDNDLHTILNEIRTGSVSQRSRQMLAAARNTVLEEGCTPARLFTHNADADRVNGEQLSRLSGGEKTFTAQTKGSAKVLESLKKSVQAPEVVRLKVGARVMFVRNNMEAGYINGSLGEVTGWSEEGLPEVKLMSGLTITAEAESWTVDNDRGKALATYTQVPLRLAWAITVHKSQGMTLDAAEVDLGRTFERGQGYVALSRLRSLKTLRLTSFNEVALETEELAIRADRRFRALSDEAMRQFADGETLKGEAEAFIKRCGGVTDGGKRGRRVRRRRMDERKSTYEITREYVEKGLGIPEIAHGRGLSPTTIISHLSKLKDKYPGLDLSACRPAEDRLREVRAACTALAKGNAGSENPVRLTPIYHALNGSVPYEDIRLALLFVDAGNGGGVKRG